MVAESALEVFPQVPPSPQDVPSNSSRCVEVTGAAVTIPAAGEPREAWENEFWNGKAQLAKVDSCVELS